MEFMIRNQVSQQLLGKMLNRPIDAMRDGQKTVISQDLLFTGAQYTKET